MYIYDITMRYSLHGVALVEIIFYSMKMREKLERKERL